jgi:hypothetical protein
MYLKNLHMHLLRTRNKLDYDMFILAIVAVVILPQEMLIGMCTFCIVCLSTKSSNDYRNTLDERYRTPQ